MRQCLLTSNNSQYHWYAVKYNYVEVSTDQLPTLKAYPMIRHRNNKIGQLLCQSII